jgi:O-antigen ligase
VARGENMKNKYIDNLNKISIKGVVAIVALLFFLLIAYFSIIIFKFIPDVKSDLLPVADHGVVNYVEIVIYKILKGMGVWPFFFFLMSGLFFYVMYNIRKIISMIQDEDERKTLSENKESKGRSNTTP